MLGEVSYASGVGRTPVKIEICKPDRNWTTSFSGEP